MMKIKGLFLLCSVLVLLSGCGDKPYQGAKVSSENAIRISFLAGNKQVKDVAPATPENEESYQAGTKLLSTQWGQQYPFNGLLKEINGQRPVTGCLPTALAQLLQYHQPKVISQIRLQNGQLAPNGILRYDNYLWDEIEKYSSGNHKNAIGLIETQKIIRDIGFATSTQYSTSGSKTSITKINDFLKYFGYKNKHLELQTKATLDTNNNFNFKLTDNVKDIIIFNINKFEPVLLILSGREIPINPDSNSESISEVDYEGPDGHSFEHAVIIDGYKFNESNEFLVHINWGWSGRSDGFYKLDGGLKLHLTRGNHRQSLAYFPSMDYLYNFTKCSNTHECPFESPEQISTKYNKDNGFVTSSSSANHYKTPIATLDIYATPLIKNFSGAYKLTFKNIRTLEQFSYKFTSYSSSGVRTKLHYNGGEDIPSGRYQLFINSLNVTNADLSKIPIRFQFTDQDSRPYLAIEEQKDERADQDQAFMALDNSSPIIFNSDSTNTLLIPIDSPRSDKKYILRQLDQNNDSIKLFHNYLVLNEQSRSRPKNTNIKVGLFQISTNIDGSSSHEILLQEKNFSMINSNKKLKVAAPSTSFQGRFQKDKPQEFYLYAQGRCTISGTRGFSNQGFFYSIESTDGQKFSRIASLVRTTGLTIIKGQSRTADFDLPIGSYKLTAHYQNGFTSYSYQDNADFTLNVNCDQSATLSKDQIERFYESE